MTVIVLYLILHQICRLDDLIYSILNIQITISEFRSRNPVIHKVNKDKRHQCMYPSHIPGVYWNGASGGGCLAPLESSGSC